MTAALGWMKYTYTPGSSWGALAHTQVDQPRLVQMVALTGIGGLTFVVALGSSLAAAAASVGAVVGEVAPTRLSSRTAEQ